MNTLGQQNSPTDFPILFRIPSDFQWLVLFQGVRNGGQEEWNFVFQQYIREKVPSLRLTLLISLCATKQPSLMEK